MLLRYKDRGGSADRRRTLYLVMRYLGLDAERWDRQPLWVQRIYREGLEYERPWDNKPSPDPESWWSPLAGIWDTFGEIEERPIEQKEPQEPRIPDISAAGFGLNVKKMKIKPQE